VVVIYLLLLFALWGTVHRVTSSLLRIETARLNRKTRNAGAMNVLARAVRLLEHGAPPSSKVYRVQIQTLSPTGQILPQSFRVAFDAEPLKGPNKWQVHGYPDPDPLAAINDLPNPAPNADPVWP
jgi:hypothetical protein